MHILLAILGALGTIGMILWRIKMATDAARHLARTASDAQNYMRRRKHEKRATADPLLDVNDPREAACAILAALASHDGAISEREEKAIIHELKTHFDTSDDLASKLLAHGSWLAKDVRDLNSFISKLMPPIVRYCSPQEKHDLLSMMEHVASANNDTSELETSAILFVKRHLGL